MNLSKIWDFIAEKNIEPQDILELVEEVKNVDTTDEVNLRRIIRKVSAIAKKPLTTEAEDRLVSKIQIEGIDMSLLDFF